MNKTLGKTSVFENSEYIPNFLGFQIRMILNPYRIHAVVGFVPEHDFLFNFLPRTYCVLKLFKEPSQRSFWVRDFVRITVSISHR